jgi:hypothetical protein
MGFVRYFFYNHSALNFVFQDPRDPLRGFRRRSVILSVVLLTFLLNVIVQRIWFDGEDASLRDDFRELADDRRVNDHLWSQIGIALTLYVAQGLLGFYYGLPERAICSPPCCAPLRWQIKFNALWLLLINVAVYFALVFGESQVFLSWLFTYALYSLIIEPLLLIVGYVCCGGKESERIRDLEEERGYDGGYRPPSSQQNSLNYSV